MRIEVEIGIFGRDFRSRDRIWAGPGSDFVDDGKRKMSILGIFGCCQDRAPDRG